MVIISGVPILKIFTVTSVTSCMILWMKKPFQNGIYSYKILIVKGGKNGNGRLAFPETAPTDLITA